MIFEMYSQVKNFSRPSPVVVLSSSAVFPQHIILSSLLSECLMPQLAPATVTTSTGPKTRQPPSASHSPLVVRQTPVSHQWKRPGEESKKEQQEPQPRHLEEEVQPHCQTLLPYNNQAGQIVVRSLNLLTPSVNNLLDQLKKMQSQNWMSHVLAGFLHNCTYIIKLEYRKLSPWECCLIMTSVFILFLAIK